MCLYLHLVEKDCNIVLLYHILINEPSISLQLTSLSTGLAFSHNLIGTRIALIKKQCSYTSCIGSVQVPIQRGGGGGGGGGGGQGVPTMYSYSSRENRFFRSC